jgi:hypothetical protein
MAAMIRKCCECFYWGRALLLLGTFALLVVQFRSSIRASSNLLFGIDVDTPFPHSLADGSASTDGNPPILPQDSSKATVMAVASGYPLHDYQRFVGSLRKTGYSGHIILAVSPDINEESIQYLLEKNVSIQKIQYVNCTGLIADMQHDHKPSACFHPYPFFKTIWGRFPLLRDYLLECADCTGPVLVTDMRDVFFQRDPFGPDAPPVDEQHLPLQLFEEDPMVRTTSWLFEHHARICKNLTYDLPMLCAGTTIGTRAAMLGYLQAMQDEMMEWMADPACCCFPDHGEDQSIHNYIFYHTDRLSHLAPRAIPNGMGLVLNAGMPGHHIRHSHLTAKQASLPDDRKDEAWDIEYDGINETTANNTSGRRSWIGTQYGWTDSEGFFIDRNGERSFVVHQYDRFGHHLLRWIEDNKDILYE